MHLRSPLRLRHRHPLWQIALALATAIGCLVLPATCFPEQASSAPQDIVFKNATVMTASHGTIEHGSVWVHAGKIAGVGASVNAPADAIVVDATGQWLTPGIIDPHSHSALDSDVNEATSPVTPSMHMIDAFDNRDKALYQALAGGVTTELLLHGSANMIGGQAVVIKNKVGLDRDAMLFPNAPGSIKFASGENPKRVYGSRNQLPSTRMGNFEVMRQAFEDAKEYMATWDAYNAKVAKGDKDATAPKRDLKLEALADVLRGKLYVQIHCYRTDEFLTEEAIAHEYGYKIRAFHHALEMYKVADKIAPENTAIATFSDWWGFKDEAWDAIPWNAVMSMRAGVKVALKSDSNDHIRRLNQEAGKMVHYGGATEDEAIRMVTLNPAWIIGVDDRTGSIDVGKDADLVLWNKDPLSTYAQAQKVYIDGDLFFDVSLPGLGTPHFKGVMHDGGGFGGEDGGGRPMKKLIVIALLAAAPAFLSAADTPKKIIAITGARLLTVSHGTIENGTLVMADGKIAAVGESGKVSVPSGAEVVDAHGLTVYPGLIDPETNFGLVEIESDQNSTDTAEPSDEIMPHMHVYDAFHAETELIPVARLNGITNAVVAPASEDTIAGQDIFIQLAGADRDAMILGRDVALAMNFGAEQRRRGGRGGGGGSFPSTRMGLITQLRQSLFDAQEYMAKREAAAKKDEAKKDDKADAKKEDKSDAKKDDKSDAKKDDKSEKSFKRDLKLEALIPYLKGERPVVIGVYEGYDIETIMKVAQEFHLKVILNHVTHSQEVLDKIAAYKVPVIVGSIYDFPRANERYDAVYTLPAELARRGVKIAISSADAGGPVSSHSSRNLPYAAGFAVANGLPYDEALKAITLNVADMFGFGDKLGSLDVGKTANVVLANGDPLDVRTSVKQVYIDGAPVPMVSRQTQLRDEYTK